MDWIIISHSICIPWVLNQIHLNCIGIPELFFFNKLIRAKPEDYRGVLRCISISLTSCNQFTGKVIGFIRKTITVVIKAILKVLCTGVYETISINLVSRLKRAVYGRT